MKKLIAVVLSAIMICSAPTAVQAQCVGGNCSVRTGFSGRTVVRYNRAPVVRRTVRYNRRATTYRSYGSSGSNAAYSYGSSGSYRSYGSSGASTSYGSSGGTSVQSYGSAGASTGYQAVPVEKKEVVKEEPLAKDNGCDNPNCTCENCQCGPGCVCGLQSPIKIVKRAERIQSPILIVKKDRKPETIAKL